MTGPNNRSYAPMKQSYMSTPCIKRMDRTGPIRRLLGGYGLMLPMLTGIALGVITQSVRADDRRTDLARPVSADEIPALISDLGHESYKRRSYATRRLCVAGMAARSALREAAGGANIEAALRAQMILSALDNVLFAGVAVELSPSQKSFGWNEPINLTVTMTNHSGFAAKVPFELDPSWRSGDGEDARQVADMIDLAEWLVVADENGRPVTLRVDDMDIDPDVRGAVYDRVEAAPVSVLHPGEKATLKVRAFNRGWARYPLLDGGRYRIAFEYVPPWEDEALAEARVGRVISNPVEVSVTTSAPEAVSRGGAEASVALLREGDRFVVRLTNRRDQAVHVNTSFGAMPPYAQGRWVRERNDMVREVPVVTNEASDLSDFDGSKLIEVAPGGTLELAHHPVDELERRFEQMGIAGGGYLYFSYSNLLNRPWQVRQKQRPLSGTRMPSVLRETLPLRILTGWHTSNRLARPSDHQ